MKPLRLIGLLVALLSSGVPATAGPEPEPLRFGLTAVFLDDRMDFLRDWRAYLERRLGRPVSFVQRTSYQEISEMLLRSELDMAWVCGLPYVRYRPAFRLVAVPLFNGKPLYRSYLITSADDDEVRSWADLAGKTFAYSDPNSNSGFLYPQYTMRQRGLDPDKLFRRAFFTWGHRNVVEAVAVGLADAGAVDSYVFETLAKTEPTLTGRTRVVLKSPQFGHTPVVAGVRASLPEIEAFRHALLGMQTHPEGQRLLGILNLDGFIRGDPEMYDSIQDMMVAIEPHVRDVR
ncbi:MAG: phosphate/phosphite/phosphonate ABC transporter substrate-binding protein [Gammaproteobacteria bacterium]|nr:phosphate/phosphite/phosphonate ABC transporter substrate-binding protein [Gammaproteobacteria bacterium]NIR97048.1 phosphate/phosphite/phosphonate ABC transporter substrate-binding protein [Gammaproteobacteria bacterium]NIT62746.1 phosphate/phosphite/phosphonate ABC transporter substrate-binding protein [Gammaproteobacteria bacterium]NIV19704.1 phosphate/phosphite/phosphonate ABC transporter substrate-binding protein [Gammaproteobacteria bacterium]NIY31326.1 phosphate/phosphite/phosphonate 